MSAHAERNLRRFLDRACAARASAPFLWFRGRTWTYDELGAITDGLAAELRALKIKRGERVAICLPNGPEHLFTWLAAAKLGAIACPLHPELAMPEVAIALERLEPSVVVYQAALAGSIYPAVRVLARAKVLLEAGGGPEPDTSGILKWAMRDFPPTFDVLRLDDLLASRRPLTGVAEPKPDDVAEILTTSGTTGLPKAAMIPHRMSVLTGEGFASWLGLGAADRLFTCLPLSHINARGYSTLGAVAAGASLALEGKFSASRFWDWIAASGATQFNLIGAIQQILLGRDEAPEDRAHRARLAYGALALGERDHLRFEERFGLRLVIGYGLTESTFGFIHPLSGPRNLDSMGLPRRHPDPALETQVRLVAVEGPSSPPRRPYHEVPDGETGEIWLKNPATFAGYWGDKAATRSVFRDGWLRTGDLARRAPDGSYVFVARLKQIIRRRGENIVPAEVEAAIGSHPAVLETAVVGVPSPLGEEDVRAYVVLRPGARASPEELAAHCASRLAAFKLPSQWWYLARLPRTRTSRVVYPLLATLKEGDYALRRLRED